MHKIHEIVPQEVVGRDTIQRFNMQFQAAAFAALEILTGKEVDKVYCDYHDDFVVRRVDKTRVEYHFFQVKTNGKMTHQWSLNEIFALKKRGQAVDAESLSNIRNSFAGKLFHHCLVFGESCREVTILSNVYFKDEVVAAVEDLRNGEASSVQIKLFVEKFCEIFEISPHLGSDEIKSITKKLSLLPAVSYIGEAPEDFASAARTAIFKYSEIDLEYHEISEIAAGLVALVNRKSQTKLDQVTPKELDTSTGVGIEDLLSVLSISTAVYRALVAGNDPRALKSASVIQRRFKEAGANDSMIEYSSQQKVNWDIWLRNARHTYPEFDLQFLLERIDRVYSSWMQAGGYITKLDGPILAACEETEIKKFSTLTKDLLLGGVIAAIVRRGTK